MSERLLRLSESDLRGLASALRSGRLNAPYPEVAIQRFVSANLVPDVCEGLRSVAGQGLSSAQIASVIDLLLADRAQHTSPLNSVQLVTTGPEAGGTANRDTAVVVRELFATACRSVLVAGYAVYQGQRVFRALADRMQDIPELRVQMFLDVRRPPGDISSTHEVVRRFAERFRLYDWPKDRPIPEVFYFPLSLEEDPQKRAALHAKCVVVDGEAVFVSPANFTEAAQQRNIGVGLLLRSKPLAYGLVTHFGTLVEHGVVAGIVWV